MRVMPGNDYAKALRHLADHEVRKGKDGKWGIYLRGTDVRLASFNMKGKEAPPIARTLKAVMDAQVHRKKHRPKELIRERARLAARKAAEATTTTVFVPDEVQAKQVEDLRTAFSEDECTAPPDEGLKPPVREPEECFSAGEAIKHEFFQRFPPPVEEPPPAPANTPFAFKTPAQMEAIRLMQKGLK